MQLGSENMKCPKCGADNNDGAKFCKSCGEQLLTDKIITHEKKSDNKKLIIAAIAIVVIVLAGITLYATGAFGVPLENKDFEYFKMDVPAGSDFQIVTGAAKDNEHMALGYDNEGEHADVATKIAFGKGIDEAFKGITPDEESDNMKIYKRAEGGDYNGLLYEADDGFQLIIMGNDTNTMKKMAQSLRIGNVSNFTYGPSSSTPAKTTTQTTSPATTAMTILGGSFSTGGGLEDKTYASIYVGPEHAGENVKIQIFYSRDGADLNDGNIVPKIVDSSGYIEVSSADSYKYFPDHADITLYDSNGDVLDVKSVDLSPESGTQSF